MPENIFCPNCKKNISDQLENITINHNEEDSLYIRSHIYHELECQFCNAKMMACADLLVRDAFSQPRFEISNLKLVLTNYSAKEVYEADKAAKYYDEHIDC